jgi:hypothetical protein
MAVLILIGSIALLLGIIKLVSLAIGYADRIFKDHDYNQKHNNP